MKRKFTLLAAALMLLSCLAVPLGMRGQDPAPVNTILWEETWTGGSSGTTPSTYNFSGTTVYGNATLTYNQNDSGTKLYDANLATGTTPELLLKSGNKTWTISNIPTGSATGLTLTFKANYDRTTVSSTTTGITVGDKTFSANTVTYTISVASNVETFALVFTNTESSNVRIDDIELVVTTAGSGGGGGGTPTPSMSVSTNSIAFGNTVVGTPSQESFTVTYANLTANASVSLSGSNLTDCTFSPASFSVDESGSGSKTVTVTYAPQSAGTLNGSITVADATDELSETVTVTGTAKVAHNITFGSMTNGSVTADKSTAIEGETVTLTVSPNTNYAVSSLTVVGNDSGDEVTITNNQFTMPNEAVTVSATFVAAAVDVLNRAFTGVTSNSYTSWSNKHGSASDAVYAGCSAGGNSSIQLNTSSSYGIMSTTSGGKVKKVAVTWNANTTNNRAIDIYGSNTAFSSISNITTGTKIGSITYTSGASTELNISDNYKYIGIRASGGALYLTEIDITWQPNSVKTPTFTLEPGSYLGTQTVTISCETAGATIYYTTDGTTPSASNGTQGTSVTITETTTLKAIAIKDSEESDVATAVYTIETPLATMQAIYDKSVEVGSTQTTVYITFDDWVVSGANSYIAYVTDGTKGFVINTSSHGFSAGDVLSSDDPIQCTLNTYGGVACLRNFTKTDAQTAGVEVTSGSATLANIALADLLPVNSGALVHYDNLTCSVNSGTYTLTDGTTSIKVYTSLYNSLSSSLTDGKKYNITGVYTYYNENEICPRSAADIVEVTTPVLSADDVNIGYNITYGSITYTLENSVSGGVLTAAITAGNDGNWLTLGEVATNVLFTCSVNNGTARTATVRLTYTYNTSETVTKDVIVTQAAAPTPALYSYSVNGVEGETFDGTVGGEITLATGSNLNQEYTFAGWTTDPTDVSIRLTGNYTIAQEVTTFYAVYAHATSATPDRYVKVTSLDDIVAGEYIIVSDGYYLQNDQVTSSGGFSCEGKTVTIINDEISNVTTDMLWTFTGTNTAMSIKTGNYILYTTGDGNGMRNTTNNYPGTWLFATNGNGFSMKYSSTSRYCGIYAPSGEHTNWRSYTSPTYSTYADNGQLYLYKKQAGSAGTTNYYTRVFLNETVSDDIEIVGPSIIPSGSVLNMGSFDLTNATAANLIIKDGAQLITSNAVAATVEKNIHAASNWGAQDPENPYTPDYWYLLASPVYDDLDPENDINGLATANFDLYKLVNTQEKPWYNYKAHDAFTIDPEVGYLYASFTNTTIEFAGELNVMPSTEMYEVTVANPGFNLVGNPLPCNLTPVNSSFEAIDYQILNSDGSEFEDGSGPVAPCNAIVVETTTADEKVYFVDPSEAKKGRSFSLNLGENGRQISNARVRFGEGRGMSKFYLSDNSTRIYIPQNDKEMAVVCTEAQGEMPVSFRANENGQYTLTVNAENVEMNYLHLIDNMTGADIDLLQTPSYTFNANVMDYESRFRLVFAANNEDGSSTSSETFSFYSNGNWVVNNEGNATLQVIDALGRILSNEGISGTVSKSIDAPAGVYVLRLINGENVKTQKIVVR